jgi:glutamate formiminotransferase / 5-formyltetrahydrofolate cyclo-ligase
VTLECVINISEGRDSELLERLAALIDNALLDVHTDAHHNRSVFTLAGRDVSLAAKILCAQAVVELDLRRHEGVHPRLGVVDVVPFVPIGIPLGPDMDLGPALAARDSFAEWAALELGLPCFLYGPERSLPEIRRTAFHDLAPDIGPPQPDPRSGAVCIGARLPLIAYNIVLEDGDLERGKEIAKSIRSRSVRALGLRVGSNVQVSCNLVEPWIVGPAQCYDAVAALTKVRSAELVGLVPGEVLDGVDPNRYVQLDVGPNRTIDARLERLSRTGLR